MDDFQHIIYEAEAGRARITLNRAEKRNALSVPLLEELNAALWEADNDKDVHCVILRGAGGHFMAGGDIKNFNEYLEMMPIERRMAGSEAYGSGRPCVAWKPSIGSSRTSTRSTSRITPPPTPTPATCPWRSR